MDKINRIELIEGYLDMIGGEIIGRKKLHKLIYLYQAKGIDFGQDFIFHFYGVYSPTLCLDLEMAMQMNVLIQEQNGPAFKIKVKKRSKTHKVFMASTEKEFISQLAGQKASVLEVLSTLVYLSREGLKDSKLYLKLHELKGHLKSHFKTAEILFNNYYAMETRSI